MSLTECPGKLKCSVKGAPFFNGRYTKWVTFCQKWYIKDLGMETSPYKTLLRTPPHPPPPGVNKGNALRLQNSNNPDKHVSVA